MALTRKNILSDVSSRDDYIEGVWKLKREFLDGSELNTYDQYVHWHLQAMMEGTPANHPGGRNAAHSGPVFLPWHRMFLSTLEQDLQRVLGKPEFALPYWNWAEDGEQPPDQQAQAAIWTDDFMGSGGEPVASGPFKFDPADPGHEDNWVIKVAIRFNGSIGLDSHRGLERTFGRNWPTLPQKQNLFDALFISRYDAPTWGRGSRNSFRNSLEGWDSATGPILHNQVHVWVGGDMLRGHSPNDPIFFLHHCNVDRVWAYWQSQFDAAPYVPDQTESADLFRHRLEDPMFPRSPQDDDTLVADVLDHSPLYNYDSFADLETD